MTHIRCNKCKGYECNCYPINPSNKTVVVPRSGSSAFQSFLAYNPDYPYSEKYWVENDLKGEQGDLWRPTEDSLKWEKSTDGGSTWAITEYEAKGDKGDKLTYQDLTAEDIIDLSQSINVNAQRIPAVSAGALPTPTEPNSYMEVTAIGTYTYGGITIASITEDGYKATLWWNGTAWVSNGVVRVKGELDTSDLVTKEDVADLNLIVGFTDGAVASTGALSSTANTKAVWHQPVTPNTTYVIGGFKAGASKYFALYNQSKVVSGSPVTLPSLPYQFTTTSNQYFISFTVKAVADTLADYENVYLKVVSSSDNRVASTEWVLDNAIPASSIEGIDLSELQDINLFDKNTMVFAGRAINPSGDSIVSASAGHTDFIKIKPNTSILFRKVSGSPTSGYWYDEDKQPLSTLTMPSGNGLRTSPVGAHYVRANLYNSSSNISDNLNAFMISQSSEIIEYKPFKNYLKSINGYEIPTSNEVEEITNLIEDILRPMSNYENNRLRGLKSRLGFFGDSWTDGVNGALRWVRDIALIFRDKYGNGGMGWYDLALSQGEGTSQKIGCSVLTDATDTRSGTINYVDQTAGARGINIAHALMATGSSIVLTLSEGQDIGAIHFYGGASYGTFTYKIGSGTTQTVDTSSMSGYNTIPITLNGVTESITITCTVGNCIVLGVYAEKNNTYPVINKFGNRGLRAYNYTEVDKVNWQDALVEFDLDSLFYLIGTNDRTVGRTPAEFKSDIEYFHNMVSEVNPYVDMCFISPSNNKLTTPTYPMKDFAISIRDVCVDKEIGFINLIPLYGSTAKIIDKGTFQDDVHPVVNNPIAEYVYSKVFIK